MNAEELRFPIKHDTIASISVEEYSPLCNGCKEQSKAIRGYVVHYNSCLEIEAGALCEACKLITWTKTRFYPDYFLHRGANGWIETFYPKKGILGRLLDKFKSLLYH